MKRFISVVLLLMVMLAGAGEALANETTAIALTIRGAIDIALKNNTDLKLSASQVDLSQVNVSKAKANFYPNLVLNSSASISQEKVLSGNSASGTFRSANAALSSNLNLFNGFADTASYERSKIELSANGEGLSRTKQTAVFDTISKFTLVLTDLELIKVQEENLDENRELLKKIEAFNKAGSRPVSDLYKQQADTMQSELDLLDARRNMEVDRLLLAQVIGLAPNTAFSVVSSELNDTDFGKKDYDKVQVLEAAIDKRPDISQQKNLIKAAGKQVTEAKAGYYPAVSLTGSIGPSFSDQAGGGAAGQTSSSSASASIGITMSVPIFDRFVTKSNVAQAEISSRQKDLDLEKLEREVVVEVGQTVEDYNTARKQVAVAEAQLKYAHETVVSTEARYGVGASTLLDLADARAKYVEAKYNRIKAGYSLIIKAVSVEYYMGGLDSMIALVASSEDR